MTKYNWCWYDNISIAKFNVCQNWTCLCGHPRSAHFNMTTPTYEDTYCGVGRYGNQCRCRCKKFTYLNNNNCAIECMFLRKIFENEIKQIETKNISVRMLRSY